EHGCGERVELLVSARERVNEGRQRRDPLPLALVERKNDGVLVSTLAVDSSLPFDAFASGRGLLELFQECFVDIRWQLGRLWFDLGWLFLWFVGPIAGASGREGDGRQRCEEEELGGEKAGSFHRHGARWNVAAARNDHKPEFLSPRRKGVRSP